MALSSSLPVIPHQPRTEWKRFALCVLAPLVLGALSYVAWRPTTASESYLLGLLGFELHRTSGLLPYAGLVSDVFADVCWAFALAAALRIHCRWQSMWPALVTVTLFECAQSFSLVSGTFDVFDLIAMGMAVFIVSIVVPGGGTNEQHA